MIDGQQHIRLPDAVAFPEGLREVAIVKVDHTLVISPPGKVWDHYFRHGPRLPEDFTVEPRDWPEQERDFSIWDEE